MNMREAFEEWYAEHSKSREFDHRSAWEGYAAAIEAVKAVVTQYCQTCGDQTDWYKLTGELNEQNT